MSKPNSTENTVLQFLDTASRLEGSLDIVLGNARGVSFREYRLLSRLRNSQVGLTRVALAQAVALTPSAVTRALKPMEKLGLVVSEKHPRDARQSLARLTDAGRGLLKDAEGVLADYYRRMKLTAADREGLSKVVARFSSDDAE